MCSPAGAWEVTTTVRLLPTQPGQTCADTNPVGVGLNPFPAYDTIHKGGTMNEQGTRSSSANRGSGHGLWKRTGHDTFRYRVKFHGFDDNRLLVNSTTITIDAVLGEDGDQFAGVGGLSQTDLSGNTRNFCLTLVAKRMTLN